MVESVVLRLSISFRDPIYLNTFSLRYGCMLIRLKLVSLAGMNFLML
jgi:hypothetical protein